MPYIYSNVKDAIKEEVKFFECLSTRYQLPYCLLLIWTDCGEDISPTLLANIRCADNFKKIDKGLYALLFFANRPDAYTKVANKILYVLEKSHPGCRFSLGVACKEGQEDVVARAVQNLLSAKEMAYNTIIDEF